MHLILWPSSMSRHDMPHDAQSEKVNSCTARAERLRQHCQQGGRTVPAEAVQPVAQVVGAAHEDEAPGKAQIPEAALQLRALALLHRVRAVCQALLHVAHLGREALRAAAGSCIIASYQAP